VKQCKEDGCTNPIFSSGYCRFHQYKRNKTQKNPVAQRSTKKRYNIPSRKKSVSKSVKNDIKYSWGFKTQVELFNWCWDNLPHVCWISGRKLDKIPEDKVSWCCAHVLMKSQYTYWRLNPHNMRLLHPDVHHLVDNWIDDYWTKYDYDFKKWFDLQEQLKKEYELFKKENLL